MLVHWIWLSTRPGISDRQKLRILERFGDAEDVYFADERSYRNLEELTEEHRLALADKGLTEAEQILRKCDQKGIHICTFQDAAYPARLKNIPDPPLVLYYKGRLPDFDGNPVIGVVGTRKASAYGLTAAKRLGYQVARCGAIVVSGIANGIDAMAMSGALTAGGCVVGVLGNGADVIYPLSNRSLFADTEAHGCLLSEFSPETEPFRWNFPKRNRLISGLSCGVLVVEAPEVSGALITARRAADQGRDVFVVPGNIDVGTCVGSNALLRDGAIAVSSGWDVVSEYQALYPDKIRKDTAPATMRAYPDEVAAQEELPKVAEKARTPKKERKSVPKNDKKDIDKNPEASYIDLDALSPASRTLVQQMQGGERLVDDLIAETGLTAGKVLAELTLLEIRGIITRLPGKRVKIKEKP